MKALIKYQSGPGHVELREAEEPVCAGNQVKLEVAFCGICGTDLHVLHDRFPNFPPVILGHEFSGTIVETGKFVKRFRPGDRVAVLGATAVTCGACVYCRQGEFMFCRERRGMGHGVNGAFARYAAAREDQLFKIPEHLSIEEGALVEPFAAAAHAACETADLRAGDVVLISGPGPIGLLCLKLLAAQGLKVIMAGISADRLRLDIALRMGAASTVVVDREDLREVVRDQTDGFGADAALECAGVEASAANCLEVLRPLGRYVQVGHFGRKITLPFDRVAFGQYRLFGSVGYTVASWKRALRILEQGTVRLGDMITHRLPLAEWRTGFDLCEKQEGLKVLLRP